jgi:hypothetical protein
MNGKLGMPLSAEEVVHSKKENSALSVITYLAIISMIIKCSVVSYYMYTITSGLERLAAVAVPYNLRYNI